MLRKAVSNRHQFSSTETLEELQSDPAKGLSEQEAQRRLAEYGPNELIEKGFKSVWRILWEQLTATLVVILIVAAVISAVLGDYKDSVAILAIVILNTFLGVHQEYRAEQAMAALKRLAVPTVKVRREGQVKEISARDLVPGDVVLLEAGNLVPADGRLLESFNLRVQEAALTGESEPVEKDAQASIAADAPLGDRRNMVYRGTTVAYGRGAAVITETGMATELGRIADLIQNVKEEPTPLQRRLDQLGRVLILAALGIVGVIFVLGLIRGEEIRLLFLTAVSLAVAAVPEGLPAVVTIALALGAQRMLRRRVLIRELAAVETLGSVTVICSDKTGTLTENRMTVTVLELPGGRIELSGKTSQDGAGPAKPADLENSPAARLVLAASALCNDAVLEEDGEEGADYGTIGDPTEAALVVASARYGLRKPDLEKAFPRVAEAPFESARKRMTTLHRYADGDGPVRLDLLAFTGQDANARSAGHVAFAKGATDSLLEVSTRVWTGDRAEPLDEAWRERIQEAHDRLAQQGIRVLGVAFRPWDGDPEGVKPDALERDLVFAGLVGMIDPPRPEVKAAVNTCQRAGIRAVMITGDHPLTARHIAEELGMGGERKLLTGQDVSRLSAEELEETVDHVGVFARVSPEHKLDIIQALQKRGQIVAMTGDGVNDAPALKKADIGVAMGITGTDVAKEASDMVLQDDNFATIVAAVEEGRVIFDNIRKFIRYLLSANSGELWVMFIGPVLGMPLPLLPLQILWMNLITDGPPALALGVEPPEKDTMKRPPYPPGESIFARGLARDIVWIGLLMGLVSLGVGYHYWMEGFVTWQTMIFTTLTFGQMSLALAVRSEQDSVFSIGLFTNKMLLGAVVLCSLLQIAVIYVPFLQTFFKTRSLPGEDLALCAIAGTSVFWGLELKKWLGRRKRAHDPSG